MIIYIIYWFKLRNFFKERLNEVFERARESKESRMNRREFLKAGLWSRPSHLRGAWTGNVDDLAGPGPVGWETPLGQKG